MSITLCSNPGFKASVNLLNEDEDYFVLNVDESYVVFDALYNVSFTFINTLNKNDALSFSERSEMISAVLEFQSIFENLTSFFKELDANFELPPFPDVPEK